MREQDARTGICWRVFDRALRVAPLIGIEVVRAEVRDAGEHDLRTLVLEHDVLVHQNPHAEALELGRPGGLTRVVLVIAGDEERAVTRTQSRERRGVTPPGPSPNRRRDRPSPQ